MIVYELDPIDVWFGWTPLDKVLSDENGVYRSSRYQIDQTMNKSPK
jgi:hypothetical protein